MRQTVLRLVFNVRVFVQLYRKERNGERLLTHLSYTYEQHDQPQHLKDMIVQRHSLVKAIGLARELEASLR